MPNTIGFVLENDYNTKVKEIENTMPNVTGLVTTTVLNTKSKEMEKKYLILLFWLQRLL